MHAPGIACPPLLLPLPLELPLLLPAPLELPVPLLLPVPLELPLPLLLAVPLELPVPLLLPVDASPQDVAPPAVNVPLPIVQAVLAPSSVSGLGQ